MSHQPIAGFSSLLNDNGSELIIDKFVQREGCYVFRFSMTGQTVPTHVEQIYRQGFVWVDLGPDEEARCLYAPDHKAPKKYMHAVKTASLQASMKILLDGFDYGAWSDADRPPKMALCLLPERVRSGFGL